MKTLIPTIDKPELVFGFVAPIGSDIDQAVDLFAAAFKKMRYDVVDIKVTDAYEDLKTYVKGALDTSTTEARYRTYIRYGDRACSEFNDNSILAAAAIDQIVKKREDLQETPARRKTEKFSKTVFLVHQFKRTEEIELFRAVYGDVFFQVSIYSRRGARVDNLARKFASGAHSAKINMYRSKAEELVQTDESESDEHGQKVGQIFHRADFIVDLDHIDPSPEAQIKRFCESLFSSNAISPTKMEHGMFLAKGAALRSLDLSRQVGACILDSFGQVITLGVNDVPKANGGVYWSDEKFDDRDYRRGNDPNECRKKEILSELLNALGEKRKLENVLANQKVKDSQLMDALEYGRVIHAEMNAICDAARIGKSLSGATLYCTTFPCHLCSKHIIASGISKVVFLEPYPKSLTFRLHSDAAQIEGGDRGLYAEFPSVDFVHFYGVTPRRYQEIFERERRKDDAGNFQPYRKGRQRPVVDIKSPFYTQPETTVLMFLKNAYRKKREANGMRTSTTQKTKRRIK